MSDKVRRIISPLIILIGIAVLFYPSVSEYLSEKNSSRAVSVYDDSISRLSKQEKEEMLEAARAYNRLLAGEKQEGDTVKKSDYDKLLNVDGKGMMGYVVIPVLDVTVSIYHGTGEEVLQVGAGHLKGTSLPVGGKSTHAVISGHRGLPTNDLFTDIESVKIGDRFFIKVLDKTLCYEVDQILTVLPDEMDELAIQKGEDYVTLVTCTPYGVNSHRLLVRGKRVKYTETMEKEFEEHKAESLFDFWYKLPIQYRHMLTGLGVLIIFLIVRWIILKAISKKGQEEKKNV